MKHDPRFVWLDLVRGASAIAVCAGHLRSVTLCDYVQIQGPTLFHTAFYFFTGLGHQVVMVFFVLSGFFVGGSILKSGDQFDLMRYGIARLARLWTVLIPALFVTLAVDQIIATYAPEVLRGSYFSVWKTGPQSAISYSTSVSTFLGNMFFLQTILTPVFGTNGPLWSLANEFWYYSMFPLLVIAFGRCGGSTRARVASGLTTVIVFALLPRDIRFGYLVWLMGVLVYLTCSRLPYKRRPLALLATVGVFASSLVYTKVVSWQEVVMLPSDLAVGIGFSTFCVVIANWPPLRRSSFRIALGMLARVVSEISYSVYLSLSPFVFLIAALGYRSAKRWPDLEGVLGYIGWIAVLLIGGVLFWFLFERHTGSIREFAYSHLTKHPSRTNAPAFRSGDASN